MPFAPLTSTTWTLTYEGDGRALYATSAGICLLTGHAFERGEDVYEATVNGSRGFVSRRGLWRLSVHSVGQTREVQSRFVVARPEVDAEALVARATRVQVVDVASGVAACTYTREGDQGWWYGCAQYTDDEVAAHARRAFAFSAERLEGVR
jgi:hypothetical protein